MLPLSAAAILEKNRLASSSPWLILAMLVLPDETVLRFARNTEDVVWNGETWTAFPFELEEQEDDKRSQTSTFRVMLGNVSGLLQTALDQYDGLVGCPVDLYVVAETTLAENTPSVELLLEVMGAKTTAEWASLELGARNPFRHRFPRGRMLAGFCRWRFKSDECGYAGSETECSRSLGRCQQLGNQTRFGGFPGVSRKGVYVLD